MCRKIDNNTEREMQGVLTIHTSIRVAHAYTPQPGESPFKPNGYHIHQKKVKSISFLIPFVISTHDNWFTSYKNNNLDPIKKLRLL